MYGHVLFKKMTRNKFYIFSFLLALVFVNFLIFYNGVSILRWNFNWALAPKTKVKFNSTTKTILFWNTMFGDKNFSLGGGYVARMCPGQQNMSCYATHDRYSMHIQDFDAILFHANELSVWDLPLQRDPSQSYVFVNLESPANCPLKQTFFDNYFNLTMTYSHESDIPWPYYVIRDKKTGDIVAPRPNAVWKTLGNDSTDNDLKANEAMDKVISGKKRTAIWFVSNCHSKSGRERYVKDLSRYLQVDIGGKCGNEHLCPRNEDCFKKLVEPEYFFYLSFENSLCDDYVTEKLSTALQHYVVPVVYGGANYSVSAPPNSYINALDFKSPKELAQYLIRLSKEPSEYIKYFKWKDRYEVISSKRHTVCSLCNYLHESTGRRVYNSMSDWFARGKCTMQEKINGLPYASKLLLQN